MDLPSLHFETKNSHKYTIPVDGNLAPRYSEYAVVHDAEVALIAIHALTPASWVECKDWLVR